ncbi:MAG: hypothetical protein KAJ19_24465, partial [Gammaproteobacteria bacterium]|nr:hypothetical protein [Gammaproteobacteria bacterium]
ISVSKALQAKGKPIYHQPMSVITLQENARQHSPSNKSSAPTTGPLDVAEDESGKTETPPPRLQEPKLDVARSTVKISHPKLSVERLTRTLERYNDITEPPVRGSGHIANPEISVILPTFSRGRTGTLHMAIESVLAHWSDVCRNVGQKRENQRCSAQAYVKSGWKKWWRRRT